MILMIGSEPATHAPDIAIMRGLRAVLRSSAIVIVVLSITACAAWVGPESRRRGHIFDVASREPVALMPDEGRDRLEIAVNEAFPPGTPLVAPVRHIEDAGGDCRPKDNGTSHNGAEAEICAFESVSYGTFVFLGMGPPSFYESRSRWRVEIAHADGVILAYDIAAETRRTRLDREDYLSRLARLDAEENGR